MGEKAVDILWNKAPYAVNGYSVYRKSVGSEQLEKIADVSAETLKYTDNDLNRNDCYTYYVSAKAAADFLDKSYSKEIFGVCSETVRIVNPDEEFISGD